MLLPRSRLVAGRLRSQSGLIVPGLLGGAYLPHAGTPAVPGYDVIVWAGQSNSLGARGTRDALVDTIPSRVYQYCYTGTSAGTVQQITAEPLEYQGSKSPAPHPGIAWARAWDAVAHPLRKLIIVPAGVSATAFVANGGNAAGWKKNATYYNNLVTGANAAMATGTDTNVFWGIVWAHGEGDSQGDLPGGDYAYFLDEVIAGWRTDITGAANSTFVIVQMNPEYTSRGAGYAPIDAVHQDTPNRVTRAAFVPGAAGSGDDVHYTAAGIRANGAAAYAAYATALADLTTVVPDAPTGLTSTSQSSTTVTLDWTAPASGTTVTDYLIEYKESSSGTWLTLAHGRSLATEITVTGLTALTSYDFRVSSVSTCGNSAPTSTLTVSTSAALLLLWDASKSSASASITNGGLSFSRGASLSNARVATRKSTGKWYCELKYTARAGNDAMYGYSDLTQSNPTDYIGNFPKSASVDNVGRYRNGISFLTNANMAQLPSTWALNDIVMYAFDADAGKGWLGKNGTWWGGQDPAAGTGDLFNWTGGMVVAVSASIWVAGTTLTIQNTLNYTPPTGFSQLG